MTSTSPPLFGILADDLTSAADGAAPFVARGLRASVGLGHVPQTQPQSQAEVIAVDMATRSLPVAEAMARAARFARSLNSCRFLVKTVDSTLRGHVRAEISAAFAASRRQRLVLAPAFPAAGRVTRDGVQLVAGVPVAESPYANDPVHPVKSSELAELVPDTVQDVTILNADTQQELTARVAEIDEPETVLWAGSPGLATALSQLVGAGNSPDTCPGTSGDVLVVVGSANPVSADQTARLAGFPGVTVLSAPPHRGDPHETLAALTGDALTELQTGRYGALLATGGDTMTALLEAAGIGRFALFGEFEPGFPSAQATYEGRPLVLGLKAGGFGGPDTFRHAVECLTRNKERSA
ncbi:four-carbon acid sugar kinase family protein [Labrenzia sp. VG12]|uniref:four-carbon acid sugar kinase family protein n=1 Tax=Labrenzia sp. VG12 TaxID=2021862 RepID=UPI000B8BF1CA|nr:four-carbon acid sugar kinase family protein [Labrenzia sp. VG12]ASP33677.1 hypothetical protein CHH27_10815 [Labrenzia sp. VG12]